MHLFFTSLILCAEIQINWMVERQNYQDAAPRLLSAPVAALLVCLLYAAVFKILTRLASVDFDAFMEKANTFIPLLYVNAFLFLFTYAYENILFVEFVVFLLVHFFLLASLTAKPLQQRCFTFAIFLVVSVTFCEFSLRVFHAAHPTFLFVSTSYDRFRAKPHSTYFDFKLNSKGFNDVEFTNKKKNGVTRVVGLGDSFLFGLVPYKHNFFTLLENKLNAGGKKYELINMGIPGMSMDDYYNLLVHEGMPLKPDVVICHVFVQNDFKNYYASFSYTTATLFHFKEWYLYKLLQYAFRIRKQFHGRILHGKTAYKEKPAGISRKTYLNMQLARYEIMDKTMDISSWYQSSSEILEKMRTLIEKGGARLIVALIPDELQVDTKLQTEFLQVVRKTNFEKRIKHRPEFDFELPLKNFIPRLRAKDILTINLLPPFKEEARKGTTLYIRNDGHWNLDGNKLAAQEIHRELAEFLNGTGIK